MLVWKRKLSFAVINFYSILKNNSAVYLRALWSGNVGKSCERTAMHWPAEGMYSLVYFLSDSSDKYYGTRRQFHSHQKWEDMTSLSSLPSFQPKLLFTLGHLPCPSFGTYWYLTHQNLPLLFWGSFCVIWVNCIGSEGSDVSWCAVGG